MARAEQVRDWPRQFVLHASAWHIEPRRDSPRINLDGFHDLKNIVRFILSSGRKRPLDVRRSLWRYKSASIISKAVDLRPRNERSPARNTVHTSIRRPLYRRLLRECFNKIKLQLRRSTLCGLRVARRVFVVPKPVFLMRSSGLRLGLQTRFHGLRQKNPGAVFGCARLRARGRKRAHAHQQDEEPKTQQHGDQAGG